MKNIKIILIIAANLVCGIFAYGQAREASVMIDKENRNAVMIAIDQPEKITESALQKRLERSGLKDRAKNGVLRYKGVTFSEISPDKLDIYTKVEKGPNNSSVVYMAVSRGYNNFTNGEADSAITENVKNFLQSLTMDAANHSADIGINSQMSEVSKEEKMYEKLLDEQRDLQKKKSNIESRLVEIQNEINTKRESIDKKKLELEEAKAKKSTISGQ